MHPLPQLATSTYRMDSVACEAWGPCLWLLFYPFIHLSAQPPSPGVSPDSLWTPALGPSFPLSQAAPWFHSILFMSWTFSDSTYKWSHLVFDYLCLIYCSSNNLKVHKQQDFLLSSGWRASTVYLPHILFIWFSADGYLHCLYLGSCE